jgi:hypothetical protein
MIWRGTAFFRLDAAPRGTQTFGSIQTFNMKDQHCAKQHRICFRQDFDTRYIVGVVHMMTSTGMRRLQATRR